MSFKLSKGISKLKIINEGKGEVIGKYYKEELLIKYRGYLKNKTVFDSKTLNHPMLIKLNESIY